MSSVEIRTVFDGPELTALGEGRLVLSLASAAHPELSVSATLVPKLTCDLFDCLLESSATEERGVGFMYFGKDGGLQYNIRLAI